VNSKVLPRNNRLPDRPPSADLPCSGSNTSLDRFNACYVLWKHELPVVIWLEDVSALHGANLLVWDLHLLVQNPQEAAGILEHAGYEETTSHPRFEDLPQFTERGIRMLLPSSGTGVVLLPAQDWFYDLNEDVEDFLPPPHNFLDSILGYWLNISSRDYEDRIRFALCIGRLITYCYTLEIPHGDSIKDATYANKLRPEHRELHYDLVYDDPKAESFTVTQRHQYHVRRSKEIKDGNFLAELYRKGGYRVQLAQLSEEDEERI